MNLRNFKLFAIFKNWRMTINDFWSLHTGNLHTAFLFNYCLMQTTYTIEQGLNEDVLLEFVIQTFKVAPLYSELLSVPIAQFNESLSFLSIFIVLFNNYQPCECESGVSLNIFLFFSPSHLLCYTGFFLSQDRV